MAVTIQLKDFDTKAVPVGADIVYLGNSADSYNEVQSTLSQLFSSIPGAQFVWNSVAGTTQAAAVQNGYIISNAGATSVSLPTTFAVGDRISVQGQGAAGWTITASTATTIQVGSSATSMAGSVASTNRYDSINLIGIVANTTWGTVGAPQSAGLTIT